MTKETSNLKKLSGFRIFEINPPELIPDSKVGLHAIGKIPRFIDLNELADILDVPSNTVRTWLQRKQGPRFTRIGRTLRFSTADVIAWLQENTHDPAA